MEMNVHKFRYTFKLDVASSCRCRISLYLQFQLSLLLCILLSYNINHCFSYKVVHGIRMHHESWRNHFIEKPLIQVLWIFHMHVYHEVSFCSSEKFFAIKTTRNHRTKDRNNECVVLNFQFLSRFRLFHTHTPTYTKRGRANISFEVEESTVFVKHKLFIGSINKFTLQKYTRQRHKSIMNIIPKALTFSAFPDFIKILSHTPNGSACRTKTQIFSLALFTVL